MSDAITAVTDATFDEEVLKSETPVLVDFWAEWCGPCRMVGPIVEALAEEYIGRLKVVKANTEECAVSAAEYGITAIPTVILFQAGEPVETLVGVRTQAEYKAAIDARL